MSDTPTLGARADGNRTEDVCYLSPHADSGIDGAGDAALIFMRFIQMVALAWNRSLESLTIYVFKIPLMFNPI